MAIEKIIDVKIQSDQAENAVKSLRQQFREAQQDVAELSNKFGATSQEAVNAAKKASQLKDAIGDAKSLTDAFNPDAKFRSLTSSLSGVVGGFAAVQGAMGLFGTQSEDVEKTLLKVTQAMALSQGLQAIGESVDSFKQLSAVIKTTTAFQKISTAAQWLWNAAMSANPIGAIIVAITALIVGGYALIKMFKSSSDANEKAAAATKANAKALENQSKQAEKGATKLQEYNKYQYDLAKASGLSSEQLRKLALKHKDEEIALNQKNTMLARSTFLRERDTLAMLKNSDASDEVIKAQEKLTQDTYKEFNKQRDNFYKSKQEKVALVRQQNVELKTEQTNQNKQESQTRKEASDNAKEEQKKDFEESLKNEELSFQQKREMIKKSTLFDASEKRKLLKDIDKEEKDKIKEQQEKEKQELQKQKDALKEIEEKTSKEIEDLKAKSDREKLELQKQRDLEELDNVKLSEEEKAKARAEILEKYKIKGEEIDAIELENKTTKELEDKQKEYEDQTLNFEERRAILDEQQAIINEGNFKNEEERTKSKEQNTAARIKLDELEVQSKQAQLAGIGNALSQMAQMAGESTNAGKAFAVASTAISTYSTAQAAYQSAFSPVPTIASPVLGAVYAGIAVAGGLLNIKKILAVKTPGGGGGSGGVSAPSMSAPATAPPQFNVVGNAGTNQLASSLGSAMSQNPVQAYVVSGAITTAQSLDRNIIQNASLG